MYYAVAATAFSLEANGCGSDLPTLCSCTRSFPAPRAFLSALKYESFYRQNHSGQVLKLSTRKKGRKLCITGKHTGKITSVFIITFEHHQKILMMLIWSLKVP